MISLLGSACIRLAETVMGFYTFSLSTAGYITVWTLESLFIFIVMVALIFISISPPIKDAINPPRATQNQPAALAPGGPQVVQGSYNQHVPRYSAAVPGQPGMQPVYAYQLPPGQQPGQQQQQYYQQTIPQQMTNQPFVQSVSPSREVDQMAADRAAQDKAVMQVSPATEKPVELPEPTSQRELP
jgi:hypothetical protein